MTIYVANRSIVFPGDLISTRDHNVTGSVYVDGDYVYALAPALVSIKDNEVRVIPLVGAYLPRVNDVVIGYVTDVLIAGWEVDIGSPYRSYLPVQETSLKPIDITSTDLRSLLDVGDVVLARVIDFNVTREYLVTITVKEAKLGKIVDGSIVEVKPVKVPRVIGRRGSMVNLIKEGLNCNIVVAQNGRIWVKCADPRDESFVAYLIKIIEAESHVAGLTERIRALIEKYKRSKHDV